MSGLLRFATAFLILAHAVAHLPGFLVGWQIRTYLMLPYTTRVLGGLDVGVVGTRVIGALWLATSVGMAAVALAALVRGTWTPWLIWSLLGLSMTLCVIGWPATRIGIAANLLLATILIATGAALGRGAWQS